MIRTFLIASYSILIFLLSWFTTPVELLMEAPREVVAGVPFNVEVVINKGGLDGFARFQQKLPNGFTAELIDAETGEFSFKDNVIKVFWLILPKKESLNIRYRITTDANISGKYSLDGIFSYIDGEKKYIEMPLQEIEITPSPLASIEQDTSKLEMHTTAQIVCKRESVRLNENGEIEIKILVNRGDLDKEQFAKIQDVVPAGYVAKSIETKGGIFTFQNNVAKFLWMTLPNDDEYIVAYKLIPEENQDLAKLNIKGNFSYLVDGQTVEVELKELEKPVGIIIGEQLAYHQGDLNVDSETELESEETLSLAENLSVKETVVLVDPEPISNNEDNLLADKEAVVVNVKEPNTEVSYSVQIAAGHSRINPKQYFKKLKINEQVDVEMLMGWYKYTVGAFSNYVNARDKRNTVWESTPIKDAFVTAYNSGQRITVQEALMISNQVWYQ